MLKSIGHKIQNSQLFCHKYWEYLNKNKENLIRPRDRLDFADANKVILGFRCPSDYTKFISSLIIKHNDLIQRLFSKKLNSEITLWRGIPQNLNAPGHVKSLYKKCINLKKGDILYMPEFSFWSKKRNYSFERAIKSLQANSGILYELRLPKGYELYTNFYPILPRASKFRCIENKKVKGIKKNYEYNLIKLEILPRDVKY